MLLRGNCNAGTTHRRLALQTSEDVVANDVVTGKPSAVEKTGGPVTQPVGDAGGVSVLDVGLKSVETVKDALVAWSTVTAPLSSSENPTTATTPALTMVISLVNVTVIVALDPVTVPNGDKAPLRQKRRGESVLEPS